MYNIGSHAEKTNLEVTEAILDAVGGDDDLIELVEDRAGYGSFNSVALGPQKTLLPMVVCCGM
uniref:dTDP glucose 4, 6-dehydratase n=1 Tax=uncultured haloarchaeon TaxID=160804 RepID=A5YSP6_9EURY|nr:dTDP glucose 4, 6-dehydratase [uncultured haloarchaeon]